MKAILPRIRQRFAKHICKVHHGVKIVEPWGILVAILGVCFAGYELNTTRTLREVTLFAMASEILQKAREVDEVLEVDSPTAQVGQVGVLTAMARNGFNMEGINARHTRLDDARLANARFQDAHFWGASFIGTDLSRADLENTTFSTAVFSSSDSRGCIDHANLSHADLTNSQLIGTRLIHVNLEGANLEDAHLVETEFLGIDLREVKGLTREQLETSCGEEVQLPEGWSIKPCSLDAKSVLARINSILEGRPVCDG